MKKRVPVLSQSILMATIIDVYPGFDRLPANVQAQLKGTIAARSFAVHDEIVFNVSVLVLMTELGLEPEEITIEIAKALL